MPQQRYAQFSGEIQRARDLVGLGQGISGMTHGRVDSTDLYRAALVQAVAALDSYVHGVVLDRAVDILLGRVPVAAKASTKVGLPFHAVRPILSAATPTDSELAARASVASRLSLETYQRPDDVAQALAMVGVSKLWTTAFGNAAGTTTLALSLVVQRRNRIVHQCDADPLMPGGHTSLTDQDALDSISTIETTVTGIDPHC